MNRWSEFEFILVYMYYMYYVYFDNVVCFIYKYWILVRNIKKKMLFLFRSILIILYKELVMVVCIFLLNFMNKLMYKDLIDRFLFYLIVYIKRK